MSDPFHTVTLFSPCQAIHFFKSLFITPSLSWSLMFFFMALFIYPPYHLCCICYAKFKLLSEHGKKYIVPDSQHVWPNSLNWKIHLAVTLLWQQVQSLALLALICLNFIFWKSDSDLYMMASTDKPEGAHQVSKKHWFYISQEKE